MFEILSQLSQTVANAKDPHAVKKDIQHAHNEVTRMFNISLMLCIQASDDDPEEKSRYIRTLQYVVTPEYVHWFVDELVRSNDVHTLICLLDAVPECAEAIFFRTLYILSRDRDMDGMKRLFCHKIVATNLKLKVFSLLMFDFISHINEDKPVLSLAYRNVLRADSLLHSHGMLNPNTQIYVPLQHIMHIHLPVMMSNYFSGCTRRYRSAVASCISRLCPELMYQSTQEHANTDNKRIGYVSYFFHKTHAVLSTFEGNILGAPCDVDVVLFMMGNPEDEYVASFVDKCKKKNNIHVHMFSSLDMYVLRSEILQYKLDVLVYPEVCEHSIVYWLSFSRLAPVQVASIGHCGTSGVPTIDYYISSKLYEPVNAQQHYSEKLVMLDGMVSYYKQLVYPAPTHTRKSLGIDIPENAVCKHIISFP